MRTWKTRVKEALIPFSIVASGILVLATLAFGWLLAVDGTLYNPVIHYYQTELPVDTPVYAPGEIVLAHVRFHKTRDLVGSIKWNLVDTRIYPYATKQMSTPSGVWDFWFPVERIPCDIPSGIYHFEGLVTYRVNLFREITYRIRTEEFKVLPHKADVPRH